MKVFSSHNGSDFFILVSWRILNDFFSFHSTHRVSFFIIVLSCFIFYLQKFNHNLFSLRINFFLCQYHKQQARERYLFRRVTIIKIINDTFPSILIQFFSSHRRQNLQSNLKKIWTYLTDNESVFIISTNWIERAVFK